jgi:hypothetical protein
MSVIAEFQPARTCPPEGLIRFLRQNQDRLFIAGLVAVIVTTTSLAAALTLAGRSAEIGVCNQQTPSMAGHIFLTMH